MMKKMAAGLSVLLGFLFLTAYIRSATVDVVYTDYIRLILSYLPEVSSIRPYLQGDVLTRIPITWPVRLVNVTFFGYSTTFDMLLGAAGLGLCAFYAARFCLRLETGLPVLLAAIFLVFSLDKWEMLTNGTGWMHFWAIACFYRHFLIYDRVRAGEGKRGDELRLILLPVLTVLLVSGPYCAAWAAAVVCVYSLDGLRQGFSRTWLIRLLAVVCPVLLFMASRAVSVEDIAGATDLSLSEALRTQPGTILSLFLKSFAALAIGGETAAEAGIPGGVLLCEGIVILTAYSLCLALNLRRRLYERSVLPLLLLLMGLASHVLITASRWIFLNDMYGMSSRYALQYMSGSLGILLTLTLAGREMQPSRKDAGGPDGPRRISALRAFAWGILALILTGQILTTAREIRMAPYRQEAFYEMQEAAVNYQDYEDDDLKTILQYRDPAKIRRALEILQEHHWNVFRPEAGED